MPAAAAAFRRLCVETAICRRRFWECSAAAFRRLCVETRAFGMTDAGWMAAAFGRLCVETAAAACWHTPPKGSRLRAAVC